MKGTEVRVRHSSSQRTARGRYDAGAIRHSVGGKVAGDTNMAGVLQGGHTACID